MSKLIVDKIVSVPESFRVSSFASTYDEYTNGLDLNSALPGMVFPWAVPPVINGVQQNPPTDYMYCHGYSLPKTSYPKLYQTIGDTYNTFNGASDPGDDNFRIPDFRGFFPRGLNTVAASPYGIDYQRVDIANSGGNPMSFAEPWELTSHRHPNGTTVKVAGGSGCQCFGNIIATGTGVYTIQRHTEADQTHITNPASASYQEHRPDNIALSFIIKVK